MSTWPVQAPSDTTVVAVYTFPVPPICNCKVYTASQTANTEADGLMNAQSRLL